MKVAVTGATGNVGTSVLAALDRAEEVDEVVAIARREPAATGGKARFVACDVVDGDLASAFAGADAVVHLAWAIQPAHDRELTRSVNVDGSRRVFEAAVAAGVKAIIYASSIGAYGEGPQHGDPVDESWPTTGTSTSFYAVDKADTERILDGIEAANPELRVVRLRPALIFKRGAASEIRRLFAGPLLPNPLVEPGRLPVLPWISGLRTQAVHTDDVADAYARAVVNPEARGAFNIAADPVLEPETLREGLGVRVPSVPAAPVRALMAASWWLHLQPTPPGWLDMALTVPLMDTTRAHEELSWAPTTSSTDALRELLAGMAERAGEPTPPLERDYYDRRRVTELVNGGPDRGYRGTDSTLPN